jgi:small multidrug resistance family-3 protein
MPHDGMKGGAMLAHTERRHGIMTHRHSAIDPMLKTTLLFFITALCEIVGCALPYLWLRKNGPVWLLLPTIASLALFVWLLTLHPAASGRVYAAYGGVYVATALMWMRLVDGVQLSVYDWTGAAVALAGMAIIVAGWRPAM